MLAGSGAMLIWYQGNFIRSMDTHWKRINARKREMRNKLSLILKYLKSYVVPYSVDN
jgi:hypothetical protein